MEGCGWWTELHFERVGDELYMLCFSLLRPLRPLRLSSPLSPVCEPCEP